MKRLENSTIIVTGAAGGIGEAVSKKCINEGAVVLGCDFDFEGLKKLREDLGKESFLPFKIDVSDFEEVKLLMKRFKEEFPSVNGLVNNAGIYMGQNLLDYTEGEIDRVIDVNIKGAVYFSKFFRKYFPFENQSGAIVNISSVSGQEGSSDAIYGLSKAALIGLTKSCAMNFAPSVRVNAVAPGIVKTNMLKSIPKWRIDEYRKSELLKNPITPDDVADSVVFLLSSESRRYTGAVLDINNGCYLR